MEILFPAGTFEYVELAKKVGANAVYGGLKTWNARNKAQNFDIKQLKTAITYCHENGLKFYLTLNTLMFDDEIKTAIAMLKKESVVLDAFICADLGLILELKHVFKSTPIHLSTQFGTHNIQDAQFAKEIGADRIILAREMTKEEINDILKTVDIESEVFVWGSQCISFSGSCFLGSFVNGGTANRGKCITLCRDKYKIGNYIGNYLYVPDLNCIKVFDSPVDSIKIEGRRRPLSELSAVVKMIYSKSLAPKSNGFYLSEFPEKNQLMEKVNSRQKLLYNHNKACPIDKNDVWVDKEGRTLNYTARPSEKTNYVYSEIKSKFLPEKFNISLELAIENGAIKQIMLLNHKGEASYFLQKTNGDLINFSYERLKRNFTCKDLNLYSVRYKKEFETQKFKISKSLQSQLLEYINKLYDKDTRVKVQTLSKGLKKVYIETENLDLAKQLLKEKVPVIFNIPDITRARNLDAENLSGDIIFKLPLFDFKNIGWDFILEKLVGQNIMLTKFSQLCGLDCKKYKKIFADYLIPVWNKRTLRFLNSKGISGFCASPELSLEKNDFLFNKADETIFIVGGRPTCVYTRQCFKGAYQCSCCNEQGKTLANDDRDLNLHLCCYSSHRELYYRDRILNAYSIDNRNYTFRYIARDESLEEILEIVQILKMDDYYKMLKNNKFFQNSYSNLLKEDIKIEN